MKEMTLMERQNEAWVIFGRDEEQREMRDEREVRKTMKLEKQNALGVSDGYGTGPNGGWAGLGRSLQPNRSSLLAAGAGHVSPFKWNNSAGDSRDSPLQPAIDTRMLSHTYGNVNNPAVNTQLNESAGSLNPKLEGKRLTQVELQDRMSKGSCFKCEEQWNPNHRCKVAPLSLLLVDEEEDGGEENQVVPEVIQLPEEVIQPPLLPEPPDLLCYEKEQLERLSNGVGVGRLCMHHEKEGAVQITETKQKTEAIEEKKAVAHKVVVDTPFSLKPSDPNSGAQG